MVCRPDNSVHLPNIVVGLSKQSQAFALCQESSLQPLPALAPISTVYLHATTYTDTHETPILQGTHSVLYVRSIAFSGLQLFHPRVFYLLVICVHDELLR